MIFKEKIGKKLLYRLRYPVQHGARRWALGAIIALCFCFASIGTANPLAIVFAIIMLICGVKSCFRFFGDDRRKNQLEINNRYIILTCYVTNLDNNKHETEKLTIKIARHELRGIEYYTKSKRLGFLGPADYGFTKLDDFATEDIYDDGLIEYLEKNVMEITYVKKGDFGDNSRG